jgi:hypothetical protein
MGEPTSGTVNFGEPVADEAATTTPEYPAHRVGYVESPSQVAGVEPREGEARPQKLRISEG